MLSAKPLSFKGFVRIVEQLASKFMSRFDHVAPDALFKQLERATPEDSLPAVTTLLAAVRFNADGLIPAIAQQHDTNEVLMMAWMNREALEETLTTQRVCYYSRSRENYGVRRVVGPAAAACLCCVGLRWRYAVVASRTNGACLPHRAAQLFLYCRGWRAGLNYQ